MNYLAELYQKSESFPAYAGGYLARVAELCAKLDRDAIGRAVEAMDKARRDGAALYYMANGGSAAVASHWVNDLLVGSTVKGKPGFRAYCLTDNPSSVTAIGNDSAFENIFADQLRVYLRPGDVVYAMSVSGNSENIIRGMVTAKELGAVTIGVAGMTGGRLLGVSDIAIHIPATSDEYGPVEDAFGVVEHLMAGYLTMLGGKWMHH